MTVSGDLVSAGRFLFVSIFFTIEHLVEFCCIMVQRLKRNGVIR